MSFPRYPKYKDSGVEWLGEVPEHWEVYRCSQQMLRVSSKWHDTNRTACDYTDDGDVPWSDIEGLERRDVMTATRMTTRAIAATTTSL